MEARLKQDNVNMFDPRSVGRVTWYWSNGQYRVTQPNIDRMEAVEASDYDRLLTLAEDKDSTISTLRADASKAAEELARLEAHFNAGQHCERRDCEKALVALAGANVCTPKATIPGRR